MYIISINVLRIEMCFIELSTRYFEPSSEYKPFTCMYNV